MWQPIHQRPVTDFVLFDVALLPLESKGLTCYTTSRRRVCVCVLCRRANLMVLRLSVQHFPVHQFQRLRPSSRGHQNLWGVVGFEPLIWVLLQVLSADSNDEHRSEPAVNRKSDILAIEKIQKRATKLVISLKKLCCCSLVRPRRVRFHHGERQRRCSSI